jgi:coenzyme F420 hydrogenase subunit beta
MLDLDPWTLKPVTRVAATVDEIIAGVGMQYLWTPLLSALNEAVFELGLTKLAIVGTPCMAEGARRLMITDHKRLWPYRQAIRVTIARFCTGVYMPDMVTNLLERGMGIPVHQIRSLTALMTDQVLRVSLWDGTERTIPLTDVEPFTRHGCRSCTDYQGETADISLGALGA